MYLKLILTVLLGLSSVSALTTLIANYNNGGVTGTITFVQNAVGGEVTITLDLAGIGNDVYNMVLHPFRVNYDTVDICSEDNLGPLKDNIGTAEVTSGQGSLTVTGMDLSGTNSIEGRSFVVRNSGTLRVCATIEADADYITAFAHLPAGLGGSVIFRQQDNSPSADTVMYVDIYSVTNHIMSTPVDWQVNNGIVQMDIDSTTKLDDRCGSTIRDMYNPDSATGTGCTTDNHSNCKVGDLTAKHGQITMESSGRTRKFYADLKLPLSGVNSIIGKTLVFKNDSTNIACANIVEYPKMEAKASFSNDGVKGAMTFKQRSPLDPVLINADLVKLNNNASGYHIHLWPVPQKYSQNDAVCNNVGGHFNPFNVVIGTNYPAPAYTTPEKYEVGDLSGKFGTMANMMGYTNDMTDPNLQLFGKNSVVGRSVVIHKNMNGAPRWICATIWPTENTPMTVAYAKFTYPVIGYIVLRQPKDMWFAETQIYMELDYGTTPSTMTTNHNWHVHELATGDDTLSASQRCQSVGGHYNPYNVFLNGDYSTMCTPDSQFRCELGDLVGKHGKINVRTSANTAQKYFFCDMQLPLTGPQSILGKSIVIHDANAGSARLSCADIKLRKTSVVRVSKWSAAQNGDSPTGSITLTKDALDIITGMTKVNVQLSGLKAEVAGYHIHEFPTDVSTAPEDVCQAVDTGGHVNPFNVDYPGPAAGTLDQYEIGDLSGKYNMLTGSSYSTEALDDTIPLDGPYSVVGRSIVIHKSSDGAPRWACGNLEDVTPGSQKLEARAEFSGVIKGYIHMTQYKYSNGDMSDTHMIVHLQYYNDTKTTGHNWHVHEMHVSSDCASCGGHYNPFMVDMGSGYSECGMENPLRCEMGDQARKVGQYDIGGGKRFFTDSNLNLEGVFAAAKRSFVIHGANGAAERIACANIIPSGNAVKTYELSFLKTDYTRDECENKVALSLATPVDNVLVVPKSETVDCSTATVYFLGDNKVSLRNQFIDVVRSNNHANLGKFAPTAQCQTGAAGITAISFVTLLVSVLLSMLCVCC